MFRSNAFGGPYNRKEWRANEVTILERNEAWAGEPPAFDEVRLHPIADPQAGEIAFEAGDVDYTQPSAASLQRYKDSPPANASVADYPALFYVWVGMNTAHRSEEHTSALQSLMRNSYAVLCLKKKK